MLKHPIDMKICWVVHHWLRSASHRCWPGWVCHWIHIILRLEWEKTLTIGSACKYRVAMPPCRLPTRLVRDEARGSQASVLNEIECSLNHQVITWDMSISWIFTVYQSLFSFIWNINNAPVQVPTGTFCWPIRVRLMCDEDGGHKRRCIFAATAIGGRCYTMQPARIECALKRSLNIPWRARGNSDGPGRTFKVR